MTSILVTGHKGFVGSHFYNALHGPGVDIFGLDVKEGGVDCRDFFRRNDKQWDLVIHCAAVIGSVNDRTNNPLAVATNLSIDAEMFNWAMKTKPKKIVYFSSSAAYPQVLQSLAYRTHLHESAINLELPSFGKPDAMYGWGKLTGEILARDAMAAGLNVYMFRPFSGYGTDQSLDYPFPSFIERALKRNEFFEIWGSGEYCRDFIHIDDIVAAVLTVIAGENPGVMNLGNSRATSMFELANLIISQIPNYDPNIFRNLNAPEGATPFRVCDNSKMLDFYVPKVSLEEGIERALNGI